MQQRRGRYTRSSSSSAPAARADRVLFLFIALLFVCLFVVQWEYYFLTRSAEEEVAEDEEGRRPPAGNYFGRVGVGRMRGRVGDLLHSLRVGRSYPQVSSKLSSRDLLSPSWNRSGSTASYFSPLSPLWQTSETITPGSSHRRKRRYGGPGTLWVRETSPNTFGGVLARSFPRWSEGRDGSHTTTNSSSRPLPCFEPEQKWLDSNRQEYASTWYQNFDSFRSGFMFQRPLKTGSTSVIGMILRMLTKVAVRQNGPSPSSEEAEKMCRVRFTHGFGQPPFARRFEGRDRNRSFLFTILRDPTPRSISQYYFMWVSLKKTPPSDQDFHRYLNSYPQMLDYYLKTISTKGFHGREKGQHSVDSGVVTANAIINEYDFIGITERFDESAVVLAMILNLELGDVLYMSVKEAGGFDLAFKHCMYVFEPYVSPSMKVYFEGDEWKEKIKYDAALYRAANRSLDLTIDQLGRDEFLRNLHKFRSALKVANDRCGHTIIHRCTEGGEIVGASENDCLWDNAACGMTCLDGVAADLGLKMTAANGVATT